VETNTSTSGKAAGVVMAVPVEQWVTFTLANEIYAINVMQVQEVLKYIKVAPVPGAPNYVCGIINLRGKVVTVIDTRKRFGLPAGVITDQCRIVIIETAQQVVGIMVDNVLEVVELDAKTIAAAPNVGTNMGGNQETLEFIQGVCEYGGNLLILIDLNKLLTEAEWEELARL